MGVYLSDSPVYKSVLIIGYLMNKVTGKMRAGDDSDAVQFFPVDRLPDIAFESHRSLIDDSLDAFTNLKSASTVKRKKMYFGAYVITSLNHVEMAEKACQAGARIIQYRDKDPDKRAVLKKAKEIRDITLQFNSLFIVNDHIDIACLARADGVHLGQDDLPIQEARMILPDNSMVGVSTHSLEQALSAEKAGADYIAVGPVFSTPTKKDYQPVGMITLENVIKFVSAPVVAIGGLNLDNMSDLKEIGIENVAMVRAFQQDTEGVVKAINTLFD
jgi:thiamine-phosphate pyrophosphorylase